MQRHVVAQQRPHPLCVALYRNSSGSAAAQDAMDNHSTSRLTHSRLADLSTIQTITGHDGQQLRVCRGSRGDVQDAGHSVLRPSSNREALYVVLGRRTSEA
jgi:hypothetical protein